MGYLLLTRYGTQEKSNYAIIKSHNKWKVTTCVLLQTPITELTYCLPLRHVPSKTFKHPEAIEIIPNFQVDYIWLTYMKSQIKIREQVIKMMSSSFNIGYCNMTTN